MNLLVFELHHLGDAVMAMPFLRAAREEFAITVCCSPDVAAMLGELVPGINVVPAPDGWGARLGLAARLRDAHPAIATGVWPDVRAQILGIAAGAPRRVGFPVTRENFYAPDLPWRKRRLEAGRAIQALAGAAGIPLLTESLHVDSPHHLDRWRLVASTLDLPMPVETPWIDTPALTKEERAWFGSQAKAVWAVHAGGRLTTKRWPLERFEFLLRGILADHPVAILGAPGEELPASPSPLHRAFVTRSHSRLAALLGHAQGGLVANDSYPAHLASALGRRVFAIFGSGNPAWFSPRGAHVIIQPGCPHHPCIDRCVMDRIVCLEGVTVAKVESTLAPFVGH